MQNEWHERYKRKKNRDLPTSISQTLDELLDLPHLNILIRVVGHFEILRRGCWGRSADSKKKRWFDEKRRELRLL